MTTVGTSVRIGLSPDVDEAELSRRGGGRACTLRRAYYVKKAMNAMGVVAISEVVQLAREIDRIPEEYTIKNTRAESSRSVFQQMGAKLGCMEPT